MSFSTCQNTCLSRCVGVPITVRPGSPLQLRLGAHISVHFFYWAALCGTNTKKKSPKHFQICTKPHGAQFSSCSQHTQMRTQPEQNCLKNTCISRCMGLPLTFKLGSNLQMRQNAFPCVEYGNPFISMFCPMHKRRGKAVPDPLSKIHNSMVVWHA